MAKLANTGGDGLDLVLLILSASNATLAVCAIGNLVLSYRGFRRELEKERSESEKERDTTRQMLDHITAMRKNIEDNSAAIAHLEKAAEHSLTPSSEAAIRERQLALEEAEHARKKERDEWDKLVAVARGIGWVLDKMGEEEEDSD